MTWRCAAAALVALAFIVAPAPALGACAGVPGNLVANCSFEQPVLPAGADQAVAPGGDIAGWTVSAGGDAVDFVEHTLFGAFPAADGRQSVDLNRSSPGGVEQTLATVAGASYRVVFSLSGYPSGSANCSGTNPEEV